MISLTSMLNFILSKKNFFILFSLTSWTLGSLEFMKDYLDYNEEKALPQIDNDFVYGDGSTEVTSQINEYEKIRPNKPIQGSIFVTHNAKNTIDVKSFRLGDKPLETNFIQTSQMSSSTNIAVSIYSFQLEGLPLGIHTLPSINVKVGGKNVRSLPLVIEILPDSEED